MNQLHMPTVCEAVGRGPVHPFPARMAPGIALEVLAQVKKPIRVLDPMMGSGTVLAVARSKGHKAFGVDIDPLAVLISKVWTTAADAHKVQEEAIDVLKRARNAFSALKTRDAYPENADEETQRFVRYWFDDYARGQLAALSTIIRDVGHEPIRNVLWCGFSRLIITKQSGASLAMDLSHSRPHRRFDRAPTKPFRRFLAVVDLVLESCIDRRLRNRGPAPSLYLGDARHLPLGDASIDLMLTSPPYLNAIDYMRCSKFSLVWMGYSVGELRRLRAGAIGTEVRNAALEFDQEVLQILR